MSAAQENARVKKEITNDEKEEKTYQRLYTVRPTKHQEKAKTPGGVNITLKGFPILYSLMEMNQTHL
jgi:hypothetical protein